MCAWLLEEGAAVGAARPDGATALDIAAAQGHAETVQVLAMAVQASRPEPPPASPAAPSPAPPEPDSPGAEPTAIPVVDWHRAETDREGFLADVLHALGEVGFMCLANAPGFEAATQAHTIEQARAFFDAPPALQASASIDQSPHFRGHAPPAPSPSQLSELFMYGAEMPTRAPHTDDSVPSWQRMFYGPNVWPAAEEALPGFRPAVEALGESYLQLHHALGELICEALGAPEGAYDTIFDRQNPIVIAFLGQSFSQGEIERRAAGAGQAAEDAQAVAEDLQTDAAEGHVDTTAFISLNTMDSAGLQVQTKSGSWVDMPVLPGGVCVNVGQALEHLSGGRMVATVHRVNTYQIAEGRSRISCPFFLMPMFGATLTPFKTAALPQPEQLAVDPMAAFHRSEYYYAYVLMSLYDRCTVAWWVDEYPRVEDRVAAVAAVQEQMQSNL